MASWHLPRRFELVRHGGFISYDTNYFVYMLNSDVYTSDVSRAGLTEVPAGLSPLAWMYMNKFIRLKYTQNNLSRPVSDTRITDYRHLRFIIPANSIDLSSRRKMEAILNYCNEKYPATYSYSAKVIDVDKSGNIIALTDTGPYNTISNFMVRIDELSNYKSNLQIEKYRAEQQRNIEKQPTVKSKELASEKRLSLYWWNSLSAKEQKQYLKDHPGSKFKQSKFY